ncbi:MAG: DMT family transporter [Alphaproteobacteria bacterium]|nr:DMT family transporter [Alphaproteobacteria bacterium]
MAKSPVTIGQQGYVLALLLLAISAVAVGFMPVGMKIGLSDGSNPQTLLIIRTVMGTAIFGSILLIRREGFRVARPMLAMVAAAGVCSALMNYSVASAIIRIDVSLAILILFFHPFLVVYYFRWSGGESLTLQQLAWSGMAFIGLALVLAVDLAVLDWTGLVFAGLAGLLATVMVITMVRANRDLSGVAVCFHVSLTGLGMFVAITLATGSMAWPQTTIGWSAAAGAGIAFSVAYFTWLIAAGIIGAGRASLLSFTEPVVSVVFAALLLGERLSLLQWGGVALVAAGLFLLEAWPGPPTTDRAGQGHEGQPGL